MINNNNKKNKSMTMKKLCNCQSTDIKLIRILAKESGLAEVKSQKRISHKSANHGQSVLNRSHFKSASQCSYSHIINTHKETHTSAGFENM